MHYLNERTLVKGVHFDGARSVSDRYPPDVSCYSGLKDLPRIAKADLAALLQFVYIELKKEER